MFLKFTHGLQSTYGKMTYVEGLNTDPNEWSDIECVGGGLHFTTLVHALGWINSKGYTHVWDVKIPEDETLVAFGAQKCKAHSIIMHNMRPISEIIAHLPIDMQQKLFIQHTWLDKLTQNVNTSTIIKTRKDGTDEWSNGMESQFDPVAKVYKCVFKRNYFPIGSTGGCSYSAGDQVLCQRVQDGMMHGDGRLIRNDVEKTIWTLSFRHGFAHGLCISNTGEKAWRLNGKTVTERAFKMLS